MKKNNWWFIMINTCHYNACQTWACIKYFSNIWETAAKMVGKGGKPELRRSDYYYKISVKAVTHFASVHQQYFSVWDLTSVANITSLLSTTLAFFVHKVKYEVLLVLKQSSFYSFNEIPMMMAAHIICIRCL